MKLSTIAADGRAIADAMRRVRRGQLEGAAVVTFLHDAALEVDALMCRLVESTDARNAEARAAATVKTRGGEVISDGRIINAENLFRRRFDHDGA
jgi:hypothetical protein